MYRCLSDRGSATATIRSSSSSSSSFRHSRRRLARVARAAAIDVTPRHDAAHAVHGRVIARLHLKHKYLIVGVGERRSTHDFL